MKDLEKSEISKEEFENLKKISSQILFESIEKKGAWCFSPGGPLFKYRKSDLIDKLIECFVDTEEYEKCSFLLKIKNEIYK